MRTRRLAILAILTLSGCWNPLTAVLGYPGLVDLPFLSEKASRVVSSPEGTQLAYCEPEGLFVADLATMQTRKLLDAQGAISSVAWTGDGKALTFYPASQGPGESRAPASTSYPLDRLQMIDVETGIILTPSLSDLSAERILPSPDGRYLAILRRAELSLLELASHKETPLVADVAWDSLAWAPDSTRIAYTSYGGTSGVNVVSVAIATQEKKRSETNLLPSDMLDLGCRSDALIAWKAEGIQVVRSGDGRHLGLATFDTSGKLVGEREVAVNSPGYVDCYRSSPDGRYVVGLNVVNQGGIFGRTVSLVGIDTTTHQVRQVAPYATFVTWLGKTGRFVASTATDYFIADVKGATSP